MQRFHVENAALELGLYPPYSSVPNCLVGHEHSIFPLHPKHEGLSEAGGLLQISSALPAINEFPTAVEERPACNLPEHGYGALFDSSAEMCGLNFNSLARIAALAAEIRIPEEKKGSFRGIKCQESMEGDRNLEAEVTCFRPDAFVGSEEENHAQASIAAPVSGLNFDRICGCQASRALPTMVDSYGGRGAEHSPRNKGLYMDDLQASMAALSCEPSPGEKKAFWRFLHSNQEEYSMDLVCSDEFCMYEFKVKRCMRGRSHDWTECPFAHPGEKARRRDPRSYSYSGTACPDYRKGVCRKGDGCELAHGVFECWLHPARYRTQLCKDGKACRRRVCFFAHSPSQLRLVSPGSTVSNEQLALSRAPMASSADNKAGSCFKRPPLFRDAGNGAFNGIRATGLFDDFCPQALNAFRTDGIQEAYSPISARRHNSDNSSSFAHKFEGYATRNSNQLSIDDPSALVEPNSNRNRSHGSFSVLDIDHSAYEGQKGRGYYASNCPHSLTLGNFSLNAEGNFRTHLALAGLRSSFDELMSPTSTLLGHQVFSPPPLSPPLSPAESPRASPDTAFSAWNCALSRKMASLACSHPLSYDAFSPNLTIGGDGMHSLTSNYLPNTHHESSVHVPSPLSVICNGDQIDDFGGLDALQKASCMKKESAEMSMEPNLPPQAIKDLILTLQDQRFAGMDMKIRKRCPSLLQRMQSPEASRGMEIRSGAHSLPSLLTHHSGQESRGRLNEKMPAEEMDNLDLGWVTDLVN